MSDCSVDAAVLPLSETQDVLSGILREGAQRLLAGRFPAIERPRIRRGRLHGANDVALASVMAKL
jgi:hypothetical protein